MAAFAMANRLEEHPEGAFQGKAKESLGSSYKQKKPWFDKREKPKREKPKRDARKKSGRAANSLVTVEMVYKNKGRAQTQQQNQAQAAEGIQAQKEHVFTLSCFATPSKIKNPFAMDGVAPMKEMEINEK
ncbi:hypothetical protein J1N35_005623 [Gossypium stocksii]|uniref:Uncharacterized protein n=1 Tax=Gossypium stocksii TaxID=47602 RepID=A0A9D4AJ58_9ROSI|nr:hypothetical protein J1N35_005623 [Gossypium stocksii]